MENELNFHNLLAHLSILLESESYSKSTIKDMNFILKAFATYMSENALDEYTHEIGECLIQYCEQELQVCSSRVSRAKSIVHKLNRLQQGLDGRDALWGNKIATINIPHNLKESLNAYIAYCKGNGNKQTTIHYKQWICGKFL